MAPVTTPRRAVAPAPGRRASRPQRALPTAPRRRGPLPWVIAAVVVALVALAVAWGVGAFAPKGPALPAKVGAYALDQASRRSTDAFLDSATYRAAPGDVYVANLLREAAEPRQLMAGADPNTTFTQGDVHCTNVNAKGMGGACRTRLASGVVLVVESTTRHSAQEVAGFTAKVAAETR